jgi:hypothetical protein
VPVRACDDGATTEDQLGRGTDGPSEEMKNGKSDRRVSGAGYSTVPKENDWFLSCPCYEYKNILLYIHIAAYGVQMAEN